MIHLEHGVKEAYRHAVPHRLKCRLEFNNRIESAVTAWAVFSGQGKECLLPLSCDMKLVTSSVLTPLPMFETKPPTTVLFRSLILTSGHLVCFPFHVRRGSKNVWRWTVLLSCVLYINLNKSLCKASGQVTEMKSNKIKINKSRNTAIMQEPLRKYYWKASKSNDGKLLKYMFCHDVWYEFIQQHCLTLFTLYSFAKSTLHSHLYQFISTALHFKPGLHSTTRINRDLHKFPDGFH